MPDIPIIIDDIKRLDGFDMTRCVYFHIECEDTLDRWFLGLGGESTPFLMLGLSGIIMRPLDGSPVFESPRHVDELFEAVEGFRREERDEPQMNIEIADVWIPNRLFRRRDAARGDVYRATSDLLRGATAFTVGRLSYEGFVRSTYEQENSLRFSELETKVFSGWAVHAIAMSRESRHPELYLSSDDRHE